MRLPNDLPLSIFIFSVLFFLSSLDVLYASHLICHLILSFIFLFCHMATRQPLNQFELQNLIHHTCSFVQDPTGYCHQFVYRTLTENMQDSYTKQSNSAGILQDTCRTPAGIRQGTCRNTTGNIQNFYRNTTRNIQNSCGNPTGNMQDSYREHAGLLQELHKENVGILQGTRRTLVLIKCIILYML